MGYVPPPPPPWVLTIEQQVGSREPELRHRFSRLGWRRRRSYRACVRLIELREHALYGEHAVMHAGTCPLGSGKCGAKPPPPPPPVLLRGAPQPIKPAAPTISLR